VSIDQLNQLLTLKNLSVFGNPADDPLLKDSHDQAREEDELSEVENHRILPDDNLIAVGHVENDAAILEVYGKFLSALPDFYCNNVLIVDVAFPMQALIIV
jgi:hypothetical protein